MMRRPNCLRCMPNMQGVAKMCRLTRENMSKNKMMPEPGR